jgi:hypothetical protein
MTPRVRVAGAALLMLAGVFAWRALFPGDEAMIRRELRDLAETVSFAPDQPPLARLQSAARLVAFFTPDGEVDLRPWDHPRMSIRGRDELRQTALAARNAVGSLSVRFERVAVRRGPGATEAHVELTAVGRTDRDAEERAQDLAFEMAKIDGTWLIRRATAVEYLER